MMNNRLVRLSCTALLFCALLVTSALPTLAKNEPTIAAPDTFRYHADITLNIAGSTATGYAEGEIDRVRQAFHLTIVAEEDGVKIRQELILLDDRLYIYDEQRQRWEYIDVPAGQTPEDLPETTLPALTIPEHPTAAYERTGEEMIAGEQTDKWRAAGRYNLLQPIITPNIFSGVLIEESLAAEALIGTANMYLYRLSLDETGTITELGDNVNPPITIDSKLVYTYSDFDQPVTITAPEGAVPAPNDFTIGATAPHASTPLARVTQLSEQSGAARIIRILVPAGLSRP